MQYLKDKANNPFFCILEQNGRHTINSFMKVAAGDAPNDAAVYLSKKTGAAGFIDIMKINRILKEYSDCIWVKSSNMDEYTHRLKSKGITSKCSVLVMNKQKSAETILLHLYMIKEPDKYGSWKIYGVENEYERN